MHAGNGPRHQVKIETAFEISSEPITFAQWKALTGNAVAGQDSDQPLNRLTPLMIEAGLIGTNDNLRPLLKLNGPWPMPKVSSSAARLKLRY